MAGPMDFSDSEGRARPRWMWASEKGQTLVIVALLMLVLMALLAMVIDVGNIYVERRLVQRAADAGALAGVRALSLNQTQADVLAAVNDYAVVRNGAGSCQAQILSSSVTVTASKTFNTYFASVVGIPHFNVQAVAQAGYSFPSEWRGGLMPLLVKNTAITLTRQIQIWDDKTQVSDYNYGKVADGERGWANFDGGSVDNNEIVAWVAYGYPGTVKVGDWVNGTPGTKTAGLQEMAQVRLNTVIIVPVYDSTRPGISGNGELDYHIVGFAAFYVVEVVDTGTPKYVKGQFIRYVAAQEAGGTFDSGVRVIAIKR